MTVSVEDALSIFRKWEEEKSPVLVIFRSFLVGGFFTGTARLVPSGVAVCSVGVLAGVVSVTFADAVSFEFVDPRAAKDEEGRKLLESEMTFGISVAFRSGERCIWYGVPFSKETPESTGG